jgi:hypothetical protein
VAVIPLDNPAVRLELILEQLKEYDGDAPIRDVLMDVLQADPEDPSDLARRIALLLALPNETRDAIHELVEIIDRNILLAWYEPVSRGLSNLTFMAVKIGQVTEHFGDKEFVLLRVCSDLLRRNNPEIFLPNEQITEIRDLLNQLRGALLTDKGMDAELRNFLLEHAQEMSRALDYDFLCGSAGIRRAYAGTVGSLILAPKLIVRHETSPKTWEKVTAILNAIGAALMFGTAGLQAIEGSPVTTPSPVSKLT